MPNRFKTDEFFLSNICLTSADKQIESRLQISVFSDYIKPRTMRFPRIQVTMTHNQRFRITLMQILQQTSQRTLLRLGSGVAGSLAVMGKPTHVSHPDGVSVMVLAMRSHHLFRPSRLNGAVGRNHIVVAAAYPSQRTMIAVDVRHPQGTARPVGGAVHDNKSNCTHNRSIFNLHNTARNSKSGSNSCCD